MEHSIERSALADLLAALPTPIMVAELELRAWGYDRDAVLEQGARARVGEECTLTRLLLHYRQIYISTLRNYIAATHGESAAATFDTQFRSSRDEDLDCREHLDYVLRLEMKRSGVAVARAAGPMLVGQARGVARSNRSQWEAALVGVYDRPSGLPLEGWVELVGPLPPPNLASTEFVLVEGRRIEAQSMIRHDLALRPSEELNRAPGIVGADGKALLPWVSNSSRLMSVHPSMRAVAVCEIHSPPTPRIRRTETVPWSDAPWAPIVPGFRLLANRGRSICGFSWSPDGTKLANLEWSGGGVVTLLDSETGLRTFLTTIPHVVGYETPLWSPDGRWLLISTNPRPQLISLDQRVVIELPIDKAQVDWHATAGPSMLFVLYGDPGDQRIGSFDLSVGTFEDRGTVQMPDQPDLEPSRKLLVNPRVSPEGRRILVGSSFGPHGRYQQHNGSRNRVAMIDLPGRRLNNFFSPFADAASWVEREHAHWQWVRPQLGSGTVIVNADLLEAGSPFSTHDPDEDYDFSERSETVVLWVW